MLNQNIRPKRTFIAYCVLAEKLNTPGVGPIQALIPFVAEACQHLAGELFDAEKLSRAVSEHYGIQIPRLAALGLAEQLASEGLLTVVSERQQSTIYKFSYLADTSQPSPVTEMEVESIFNSFAEYCKSDALLGTIDDSTLQSAFLERLLNVDSMRILSRKEASISAKKSSDTLVLVRPQEDQRNVKELRLDFKVSQFLIDLRENNAPRFEQVSNVAFANMAAEAIACFREPPEEVSSLSSLTVYLDSPLLLDILGVNSEYSDYGTELLSIIKKSGAVPAVFDHCVDEAESAIHSHLSYLRSGINKHNSHYGMSTKPDLLSSLIGNVAERADKQYGIQIHRDPETQMHRRAQSTVGDIETEMNKRMLAWGKPEAKEYDRKSVWAMLATRDANQPSTRICDSKWILLTRNTPLVSISNDAWKVWLKGSTKHSLSFIERCSPIAMSDKQFSGYIWARTGGGNGAISRARLLAHCSSAVRPRADVKARAYNLVLELSGRQEADHMAALLEDREGAKALMRATAGDPEDVTKERLPFIIHEVKLAAGEYAATVVREEKEKEIELVQQKHQEQLIQAEAETQKNEESLKATISEVSMQLLQEQQEKLDLKLKHEALTVALAEQEAAKLKRKSEILASAYLIGAKEIRKYCWYVGVITFLLVINASLYSGDHIFISALIFALLAILGFWFAQDYLTKQILKLAFKKYKSEIKRADASIAISEDVPDFSKRE